MLGVQGQLRPLHANLIARRAHLVDTVPPDAHQRLHANDSTRSRELDLGWGSKVGFRIG